MAETSQTPSKGGLLGRIRTHYSDTTLRRSPEQIEREKRIGFGPLSAPFSRWFMFPAAFIFQAICGSLYAWSVFNNPIDSVMYGNGPDGKPLKHNAVITFYLAVGFFGTSAAVNGPWLERVGPRKASLVGTTLFFIGNMIAAVGIHTKIIALVYVGYGVIGGAGLGLCYISPVSALQKWFPDRRGLAAGFAVCGFGAGSIALAKVPDPLLDSNGDVEANHSEKKNNPVINPAATMTLIESIFSSEYRLIYLMFFGNAIAGLVFLSRLSNIVTDVFGKSTTTASTVVSVNGGFNLAGRLIFSAVSDRFGRKNCYVIMLASQIIIMASLPTIMEEGNYAAFVALIWILTACYGGGFGCIPAFLCDMFGPSNIGALHGIVLTAWSLAGVGGGLLFTAIYNNLLASGDYTTKSVWIYAINLYWLLGIAAFSFLVLLFIRVTVRDRLLPRVAGEFTRMRLFGKLIRIGSFGIKTVSKEQEDAEWAAYVQSRSSPDTFEEMQVANVGKMELDEQKL
ncbi:hypothetical protein BGW38_009757 [Lunasporangiospora selenospora]|uniref:MFS general substrate transporter n=1 Tax=Lunasporangiospora selenospora TaxID=979761 RepID=A0A9P6KFS7_9FUNG|nr:hypothetical protein BGW38_009757 [Lunasporangiospora selenospora]